MDKFDYVNSILTTKENLIVDDYTEEGYDTFITNKALSYHIDCLYYADDMNMYPKLPKKMQYNYLLNSIRSYKRPRVKWSKPESDEDIELIMEYYKISRKKAIETLELLSIEQLKEIKHSLEKGGISK